VLTRFLTNNSYQDVENEITLERLKQLANDALLIREPILYGKFLNDEHYMKTLDLVLNSTLETKHRGTFYIKNILPRLARKNNLLDIGPGDGKLTSIIGMNFKQITAVDTCEIALRKTEEVISNLNAHVTKIQGSILEVDLPTNYYDLIMVSHVLYYVELSKWMEVAELCYNSLRPGGVMVIVLSGAKLGKADLMHHFSGRSIDIDSYVEKFSYPVKIFISNESFYAYDLNTILHIAGFLLCDVNTYTTKKELINYLIENHQVDENLFKISTQQEFIVIEK
jgi:2-polyprenyl-3-methyl-5-hydroxy-6-metoxy-1,4-benzoquinol methylase